MGELTKREIEERIAEHEWYQTIPLPHGLFTPGQNRTGRKLEMFGLPEDLTGKSFLDIGCAEGFFVYEAARRGASPAVGVDHRDQPRAGFELVGELLGLSAEIRKLGVYDMSPDTLGEFDVVLFTAVLHHMRYPMLALDCVASVTREMLILEVVEAVPRQSRDQAALVRRVGSRGQLRMLPTRAMLMDVLQRAGFARVDVVGTHQRRELKPKRGMPDHDQQRVVVKAYR